MMLCAATLLAPVDTRPRRRCDTTAAARMHDAASVTRDSLIRRYISPRAMRHTLPRCRHAFLMLILRHDFVRLRRCCYFDTFTPFTPRCVDASCALRATPPFDCRYAIDAMPPAYGAPYAVRSPCRPPFFSPLLLQRRFAASAMR